MQIRTCATQIVSKSYAYAEAHRLSRQSAQPCRRGGTQRSTATRATSLSASLADRHVGEPRRQSTRGAERAATQAAMLQSCTITMAKLILLQGGTMLHVLTSRVYLYVRPAPSSGANRASPERCSEESPFRAWALRPGGDGRRRCRRPSSQNPTS